MGLGKIYFNDNSSCNIICYWNGDFQTNPISSCQLSDLFLLFIYAEVLGMVGSFYASSRLPVTLPIIIAMTALTRMIILQSKEIDAVNIIYEASGILILALAAYIMTLKDKISLEKLQYRKDMTDK